MVPNRATHHIHFLITLWFLPILFFFDISYFVFPLLWRNKIIVHGFFEGTCFCHVYLFFHSYFVLEIKCLFWKCFFFENFVVFLGFHWQKNTIAVTVTKFSNTTNFYLFICWCCVRLTCTEPHRRTNVNQFWDLQQ